MSKSGNLFRSKVARRIFVLFVISSLIPVLILSILSLYHVRSTSSEQIVSGLKQDAKLFGLSIFDRLQVVEEELLFHASMLDARGTLPLVSARDSGHLYEWHLHENGLDQEDPAGTLMFSGGAMAHMQRGRSVLSVVDKPSEPPALYLSRIVNLEEKTPRILTARIHQYYLWGDPDRFNEDVSACVLSASYEYIHCTDNDVHPIAKTLKVKGGLSGDLDSAFPSSEGMLMGRWVLFIQPNYLVSKWNILLFHNRQAAFSQFKQFSGIYAITILLVIFVVVLLSIYLIRRNTVPLEALMRGIREISEHKFGTRVTVASNDEYGEVANAFNTMSARIGTQIKRLKTQAYVDRLILSRPSVDDIVEIAHDGINRLVLCDWAELALREDEYSRIFHLRGGKDTSDTQFLSFNSEIIDLASRGESILVKDASDPLRQQFHQASIPDCNCYLMLPVVDVDFLFGVFILGYQDEPQREEIEHGREFADRIAVALANAAWEARLYNQARYDSLTSLPNRSSLEERLEQEISHASRANECLAVFFLDLDRFKNINDSLGHEFGDAVLKEMSSRLGRGLREEDTIARLGGDEFVVMLRGLENPGMAVVTASSVAEKIIHLITQPLVLDDHEIRMTTSIGISVYPTDANDMNTLLRNADSAMYHAKDLGRGNYQFYSEELNAAAIYRLEMETKLHRAIEQDEFVLYYQPKIDSRKREIISCEALIRWISEDGTIVSPTEFISVAEDIGLTTVIGEWALKVACMQAKEWAIPISVNISARHFYHGNLVTHVESALHESNLDPGYLEIEITETTTMHNLERTVAVLTALKGVGVRISIDDFGTGHSSLNYLKHFPVDTLKIDRIFIKNILNDKKDLAIVKSTVSLAHNLGLSVVAEGVELEEQRCALDELGCDELQGFLFSHALPVEKFFQLLERGVASENNTRL